VPTLACEKSPEFCNLELTETYNRMARLLAGCCLLLIGLIANSQTTIDVDKDRGLGGGNTKYLNSVAGTPFLNTKFSRLVEGTPFFNEQMMRATLISNEGNEYKNVLIRLNLMESQVNYIDDRKTEMIVAVPVKEVILHDSLNNKDHRFVFSNYIETIDKPEKDFYELLQTGKVKLYKQHKKRLMENKPYGSATYEQYIKTDIRYFVLVSGKWIKIRKIKELTDQLTDKENEIQKFVDEKKLTKDSETNFEAIVAYYNTLPGQQ